MCGGGGAGGGRLVFSSRISFYFLPIENQRFFFHSVKAKIFFSGQSRNKIFFSKQHICSKCILLDFLNPVYMGILFICSCLGGLPRNSVARLTDRARNDLKCVEGP